MDAKSSPSHQTPSSGEKIPHKPVRMRRWMIIIGGALVLLLVVIVGFNHLRSEGIKKFFASMKPPPTNVSAVEAKSEVLPNLLTGVGDLAAVHQVNVTTDVSGRVTEILFTAGTKVKAGDPLIQIFDAPDQSDLASYKAQTLAASLALDRAKALAARRAGLIAIVALVSPFRADRTRAAALIHSRSSCRSLSLSLSRSFTTSLSLCAARVPLSSRLSL